MLKFYLYENNTYVEKNILVAPTLTETFDETLDTATIILEATDSETLIKPDTKCKLEFDDTIISNLVVATDDISIFSHSPLKYQHTLQLVQNTRVLQKHLIRNSVFSQPRDRKVGYTRYNVGLEDENNNRTNVSTITLGYNEKVCPVGSSAKLYVNLQCFVCYTNDSTTNVEVTSFSKFKVYNSSTGVWSALTSNTDITITFNVNYVGGSLDNFYYRFKANKKVMNAYDSDYTIEIPFTATDDVASISAVNIYASLNGTYLGDVFIFDKTVYTTISQYGTCLNFRYYFDTYYWSMYDVIDTLRKQYVLSTTAYPVTTYLFEMPDSTTDLYKILKNTIAPQFTFTGATMYECLAEIFKYYDAIFTLDENNKLGIEYLNDLTKAQVTANFINRTQSFKEDGFTTGYVSYFENAIIKEDYIALARNTDLGLNTDEDTYSLILPHDIQSIIKAEMYLELGNVNYSLTNYVYWNTGSYLDVTDYILSSDLYSLLTDINNSALGYLTNAVKTKTIRNCLSYSGNVINLGKYNKYYLWSGNKNVTYLMVEALLNNLNLNDSSVTTMYFNGLDCKSDWYKKVKFKIRYFARTDGRVRIENETNKYNGEITVNQSSGGVDINKMGLNMLGLSYKMGEPNLSANQEITTWANRIKKGQILTYNNERYLANVVKYTFYNDKINTSVEFVKNYNALSQRIVVDRQKRLSQISNELTIKSEDNYCEYLYFSTTDDYEWDEELAIDDNYVYLAMLDMFYGEPTQINFGIISTYKKDNTLQKEKIYIPITKYVSGNSLCFEMFYDSPISAGNHTKYDASSGDTGYTSSVIYTDDDGWADKITLDLCDYGSSEFESGTTDTGGFPFIETNQRTILGTINKLEYYKKPNEIFSLNYELIHLVPPEKNGIDFVGNELVKYNGLYKPYPRSDYYIYYSTTEKYSPLDLQGLGNKVSVSNIDRGYSTTTSAIKLDITHPAITCISWALCDYNGNILFASNTSKTSSTSSTIYVVPRHNRL